MANGRQLVKVEADPSMRSVAQVSFQAGWRAACEAMAGALEAEGAPPHVVENTRRLADLAPVPRVGIGFSEAEARADLTGEAVRS